MAGFMDFHDVSSSPKNDDGDRRGTPHAGRSYGVRRDRGLPATPRARWAACSTPQAAEAVPQRHAALGLAYGDPTAWRLP